MAGRLLLVDMNSTNQVQQILPNSFTESSRSALISTTEPVFVPDKTYRFRAFRVGRPLGLNKVLAVVVPKDFPVGSLVDRQSRSASISNVEQPAGYLMNLTNEVKDYIAKKKAAAAETSAPLPHWSMAVLEYKIE